MVLLSSSTSSASSRLLWIGSVLLLGLVLLVNAIYVVEGQTSSCPEGCSCLGELVDCTQKKLVSIPGPLGSHVTKLHLQDNKISAIPDDCFTGLINLKQLMLSNNKVTDDISGQSFRDLISLRKLGLSRNRLTKVPDLGNHLGNMTRLLLSSNKITEIPAGVFDVLPRLRMLDLSDNKIRDIPRGTFGHLKNLFRLVMSNNRITELIPGSLDNLTVLNSLNLAKNRIESVSPDLFAKLGKLSSLDLSSNQLQTIPSHMFQRLSKLGILALSHNQISQLDEGVFTGLGNLHQLELGWNQIDGNSTGWLNELPILRNLMMNNNRINLTDAAQWKHCDFLEILDLSSNGIAVLERGSFRELTGLVELSLSQNQIHNILDGAFIGLSALQALDLSQNALSWGNKEGASSFDDLTSLIQLNLSYNQIDTLTNQAFSDLPGLQLLDLSGNAITSIQNNAFSMIYGLTQLVLNSASMICDCELKWFPVWIREFGQRFSVSPQCAFPDHLSGLNLLDVNYKNFTCVPDEGVPPVVTSHPEGTVSIVGLNITLECRVALNHELPYTVNWLKDGEIVTNTRKSQTSSKIKVSKIGKIGNLTEFMAILHMTNVGKLSQGHYQCRASNTFGSEISEQAMVTIYTKDESSQPIIIEHPKTAVKRKGDNVTLDCMAIFSGDQPYSVFWLKDGVRFPLPDGKSTSAAHKTPSNPVVMVMAGGVGHMKEITTSLNLNSIQEEHKGRYRCVIANTFGRQLSMEAVVSILTTDTDGNSHPVIVTHPESSIVALVGYNVTLRCEIAFRGEPNDQMEVVNWLKDGAELPALSETNTSQVELIEGVITHQPGEARIVTTLLSLRNIQEDDQGNYQCTASNQLGTEMSSKAVVTVHGETQQPVIIVHPVKSTVAMRGTTNVTLACVAAFSGDQPYSFNWLKDAARLYTHRQLQEVLESTNPRVQVSEERGRYGNMREITILLHLNSIQVSDQGTYQCTISNNYGRQISKEASVIVQAFPSFTITPRDSTIDLGGNIKLQCNAKGHPTPQISWRKDGEEDFPADREMRFISIPNKHDFFIVNVKIADEGTYSCVAKNDVGEVVVKAKLSVTENNS